MAHIVLAFKNGEGKGKQSAESKLWGHIAHEICFLAGGKQVLRGSITFKHTHVNLMRVNPVSWLQCMHETSKQEPGKKRAKVYLCDYSVVCFHGFF